MNVALIGSERGVVEAPVHEIIHRAITVPFFYWEIDCDLHPVALGLVVSIPRRSSGAGV